MKAVILAAGKATRLSPYSKILPKTLMPISFTKDNKFVTIIERLIEQIKIAGIQEIIIVVNHKAELIKEYLGDGSSFNCRIEYVYQEKLDGNAGAFFRCQKKVGNDSVLIADCDNYLADDGALLKMRRKHEKENPEITVAVAQVKEISKFAIIKVDKKGNPVDIYEKPTNENEWGNLAKSGIMIFSSHLSQMDKRISATPKKEYTTTQILKYCMSSGLKVQLFQLGKFNDLGTWAEYSSILRQNIGKGVNCRD